MSEVKTAKLSPRTGAGTVTLGTSGDTFDVPSGVTLDVTGATVTGLSAGKVLQVVGNLYTTTESTTTNLPSMDTTGLSQAITPSSTSSKVLIQITTNCGNLGSDSTYWTIIRGATEIGIGTWATGLQTNVTAGSSGTGSGYGLPTIVTLNYLDSPSTTSAITYGLKWAAYGSTSYMNRSAATTNDARVVSPSSSIILMEIEG
jgi:hypothetical protein